jgi:AcrR family transcriptional regulator
VPRLIDHEQRKDELGRAVWDVIVHQGVGAVSVRTVAARAGLSLAALRHVFPTRAELVEFAGELTLRQAAERIEAVPGGSDPVERALATLRQLLPLTPQTRAEFLVNLALLAEAPAIPSLADIRDRTLAAIWSLCRRLVASVRPELAGTAADLAATRLAALLDGLALRLLATPDQPADWALTILRAELIAASAV